jgi:hypothetical protein
MTAPLGPSTLYMWHVQGLNPAEPGREYWVTLWPDPATRNERLMYLVNVKVDGKQMLDADGNPVQRWKEATFAVTGAARQTAERQRQQAHREAGLAAEAAPARQAAAAAEKLPVQQKAAFDDFLRAARGGVTVDEVRKAAANMEVAGDWLIQQLLDRGISVSGLGGAAAGRLMGGR